MKQNVKIISFIASTLFLFSCHPITLVKNDVLHSQKENSNELNGNHKSKVAILGLFHFDNLGLDTYKPEFDFDILSEKRQAENNELLSALALFKPTKILIERNRILSDSIINAEFLAFLANDFDVSDKRSEIYQIGFKLAKLLGHTKIYCSDATADWFGVELDWDNYDDITYVKSKGQYEQYTKHDYSKFYRKDDSLKTVQSLKDHLYCLNEPKNRLKDHQAYLTSIIEGAGDNYLGADNVARWYRRNLRIFSNVYDLANFEKEERLLLIYGSGHVYQLKQFFTDSPDFDYIEINEYLK